MSEPIRLNKFIAHYSTYSRREADRAIQSGFVRVNDAVQTNPATQVTPGRDVVFISGKRVVPDERFTVIVYNKPRGELVTKSDPRGRRTIYDTLDKGFRHFIPIGRLDFTTEGLLLLTDSSPVASALMHSELERVYKIKIKGAVTPPMEKAMEEGLELEDATAGAHDQTAIESMHFAPFYAYQILKNRHDYSVLKIAIGEGKNRELRRFFAHFGTPVVDLRRLSYGGIALNSLPTGKSRYLHRNEYANLRKFLREENT